ncbi:MAG: sigma-70 family RNA polymerase sigma factor [Dysgonamonadaceae bacterium]|jgi:RNA polymerase sigma-70 factor (ECF subfamily)|nr:sigma-70 family RNA polymerase sigma factor [Dysgonamonadaceae bacterium]
MSESNEKYEKMFRFFVNNNCEKVIRFISLFVPDRLSCEELASDVFMSIWLNREKLPDLNVINNYMLTVARNKALNYLRDEKQETLDLDTCTIDIFRYTETTPESIYISKETVVELNKAINELPHRTKLAFTLVREQKKSYKEAAEILSVSVKTVEKQVAVAVEKLKEKLRRKK